MGAEAGTAPDGFGSWELLQQQQEAELEFRSCSRDKEGRKEGRKEGKLKMTLSNVTSASAGEASVSSGSHTDHEYDGNDTSTPPPPRSMTSTPATTVSSGQQQQPPLGAAGSKRKRNLPGTPGMYGFVLAVLFWQFCFCMVFGFCLGSL